MLLELIINIENRDEWESYMLYIVLDCFSRHIRQQRNVRDGQRWVDSKSKTRGMYDEVTIADGMVCYSFMEIYTVSTCIHFFYRFLYNKISI